MGYEIAGGLGAKMAAPERDVYVIVGDGSYLMLSIELVTSIQEGYKLIVILLDNSGFKSIGSLSRSLGQDGFGTRFVFPKDGQLVGDSAGERSTTLPIDFAMNARSLGAEVIECASLRRLRGRPGGRAQDRPHHRDRRSRTTATTACPATKAGGTCRSPRSARCPPSRQPAPNGKRCAPKNVLLLIDAKTEGNL